MIHIFSGAAYTYDWHLFSICVGICRCQMTETETFIIGCILRCHLTTFGAVSNKKFLQIMIFPFQRSSAVTFDCLIEYGIP